MPAADTEALLDALDRLRDARGSVPLFDALAAENADAVLAAFRPHLRHPLAAEVSCWLAARGRQPPEPESLVDVAARLGVTDLEGMLTEEARVRARLSASLDEAWARARKAETVASAYAAILVLLAAVAILGWLAALGVVPFPNPETDEPRVGEPSTARPAPR